MSRLRDAAARADACRAPRCDGASSSGGVVQAVQWCTWQPLSSFESSFASSSRSHAAASISGGMFFATSSGIGEASSHRSDLTRPAVEAATRRWHGGCGPRRSASETVQQQAAATSATKRLPRSMSGSVR